MKEFALTLGLIFIFGILLAIPTYFLWNWLMPTIFNLTEITLFQAWGLNVLSNIFLKASFNTNNKK